MGAFLELFAPYDHAARIAIITAIASYGVYVMLRAGIFALPHEGFMAVGAYVAGILSSHYAVPVYLAIVAGTVAGSVVAFLVGLSMLRLDGIRLAMATIVIGEITRLVVLNLDITGGASGLVGIPIEVRDDVLVAVLVVVVLIFVRLGASPTGKAMDAMRHDPLVAAHQGVHLQVYRVWIFMLVGAGSGLAGGLYAHIIGFVSPDDFSFGRLIDLLASAVIGGTTVAIGPLIGAAIIVGMPQVNSIFDQLHFIFNGLVIVLVIAFFPNGVAGTLRWPLYRLWRSIVDRIRPRQAETAGSNVVRLLPEQREQPADGMKPILEIDGVSVRYGALRAVDAVSLQVFLSEIFGIIGPNGSGKTTLLNALSGIARLSSGKILLDGREVVHLAGRPDAMMKQGVSRTFQGIRLIPDLTLKDNVLLGALQQRKFGLLSYMLGTAGSRREDQMLDVQFRAILSELNIQVPENESIDGLPYGLLRRLEIARAIIAKPRVLMLDEPTAGMTPDETAEIFSFLRLLAKRGIAVIIVEHDVEAMRNHCDRLAVLDFGKLITVGPPADVLRNPEVIDAYFGAVAAG